jgi:hypothetical protein
MFEIGVAVTAYRNGTAHRVDYTHERDRDTVALA